MVCGSNLFGAFIAQIVNVGIKIAGFFAGKQGLYELPLAVHQFYTIIILTFAPLQNDCAPPFFKTMSLLSQLETDKLPTHIAIIMDGNGRWAKEQGKDRLFGHINGVESVREVVEAAAELQIDYLTLYTFSTENWDRPAYEVDGLMELLVDTIRKEVPTLNKNNISLKVIGHTNMLPEATQLQLAEAIAETSTNTGLTVIMALSYSSRWEMEDAIKQIATEVKNNTLQPNAINADTLKQYLNTSAFPDPELLIRTSGEFRLSNFLLYQLAYTELYFTPTLWPNFRKEQFYEALFDYQQRERRFGKTGDQIKNHVKQH